MTMVSGNSLFTPDNLPESKSLVDIKPKRLLAPDGKKVGSKVYLCSNNIMILMD